MTCGLTDTDLYKRVVIEKSLSLSEYLELKKPHLLSQTEDVRDAALSEITDTISSLPNDFLTGDQVALLLEFFLGRLESSPASASHAVRGANHLVCNSQNLPSGFEKPLVQIMFTDGNVQGWDTENRLLQYEVLQWLLLHRLEELASLGSNFVLTFIRTVGGERHPRCLPVVFRMFVVVAQSFPMGPLVEDLFEVVACYFPIEYKASSSSTITKELLAEGCLKCLVAHRDFAPFCYLLIEEKFTDDESTPEQKGDTCELLAEAASIFPAEEIVDHLEPILGGIRVVALNPKGVFPHSVSRALTAITKALSLVGEGAVTNLGSQLVENLEPFVLQAEMGLTERALTLFRCATEAGPAIRNQIYNHVVPWILMLVQGDVVNVRANRLEITQEGLRALSDWVECIHNHGCDAVLSQFESSLFASLEVARETAPNEALTVMLNCLTVYLRITPISDDIQKKSQDLIKFSWNTLMAGTVKTSYLRLITAVAETDWESMRSIISEKAGRCKQQDFPMLCAAVHDEISFSELSENIFSTLAQYPCPELFEYFLTMATRLAEKSPKLVSNLVHQYLALSVEIKSVSEDIVTAYAETLQSLGLLLDGDSRLELVNEAMASVKSSEQLDMICLFVVQSQNVHVMERCLGSSHCDEHCAYLLCVGIANHLEDMEQLKLLKKDIKYEVDCAIAKGLLLSGKREGVEMVQELLNRLCSVDEAERQKLCAQLCDLFDFDNAVNDPRRCLYRTTFLWKQRIFNQLSTCYVTAVNSANQAAKDILMSLLPALLKSSVNNLAVEQQFHEFKTVFRVALSTGKDIQPAVLSALPRYVAGLQPSDILPEDGLQIIKAVTATMDNTNTPMTTVLACLESLELLAQRASYDFSDSDITIVIGTTTKALGHRKRLVRQKAALVRNIWESKRQ
ncbi:hypothetical protein RB195_013218 [Necator americanus]|uniref:MMS19 nucleotide excision repair protein n=1 Tax=Necator americanus TaxID=51031 RepID=A0ABR1DUI2_NECAM